MSQQLPVYWLTTVRSLIKLTPKQLRCILHSLCVEDLTARQPLNKHFNWEQLITTSRVETLPGAPIFYESNRGEIKCVTFMCRNLIAPQYRTVGWYASLSQQRQAVLCRLLNDCLYLSDLGIDIVEFIKRLNESGESSIARSSSYKKDIAIFLEVVVTRVTDGRTEETDGQIKILGHIESSVQCQPLECSWSIICNLP